MQNASATGKLVYCLGNSYKLTANVSGNFTFARAVAYTGAGQLLSLGIQQPASGKFWSSSGAAVNRFGDRVFIGDAVANDGALPPVNKDWLSTYFSGYTSSYYTQFAQGMSLSSIGGGFLGASHTAPGGTNSNAYGLNAFALADHASATTFAWGIYAESHRVNSHAGNCYGMEIAIVNRGGTVSNTPYSGPAGTTIGIQIDSGAGFNSTQMPGLVSASTGIQFVNNTLGTGGNGGFLNGIVFGSTSLSGCDGVTGSAVAIAMAKGHMLQWYSGSATPTASVSCSALTSAASISQTFSEGAVFWANASGGQILTAISQIANAANYPALVAGTTGAPAILTVGGTDTDVDLGLQPKGGGSIKLTNSTSTVANGSVATVLGSLGPAGASTTVRKWWTLKDSGGTSYYIPLF